MDANTKALFRSKQTDDWGTPKSLYDQLNAEFHFDLDPCPLQSEIDGLSIDWNGSIFVNPPYSKVEPFLIKAHNELRGGAGAHNSFPCFRKHRYRMVSQIHLWESRDPLYQGPDKVCFSWEEIQRHEAEYVGNIQER